MTQPTIGFIGAGNMAASLIGGLVAHSFAPGDFCAAAPNATNLQALAAQHGIHACTSNAEVAQRADILVLAVKPQVMNGMGRSRAVCLQNEHLDPLHRRRHQHGQRMEQWLGGAPAVVRSMPNTPALVQQGASGLVANAQVNAAQREQAERC